MGHLSIYFLNFCDLLDDEIIKHLTLSNWYYVSMNNIKLEFVSKNKNCLKSKGISPFEKLS